MPDTKALFDATFADSPIGMAVLDANGVYLDVNPALCAMVGYSRDELLGDTFTTITHPDDVGRDEEMLAQLGEQEFPYYQTQKRYFRKDETEIWVRVTVVGVRTPGSDEVSSFVVQVEDVTQARKARERLETRAFYDRLTGLATRELLMQRIEAELAAHEDLETSIALIFVDLDHFKLVNDSLGHDTGDHLLAVMAQRLQSAVRRGDTVARVGGDEFVVLLRGLKNQEEAEERAAIVTQGCQRPVSLTSHEIVPTVSAGLIYVDEPIDPPTLLKAADTAMYAAKQSGRSAIQIFDSELEEKYITRLEIEHELRDAVRKHELRVFYQPVVDLQQLRIAGYEAFVRWQHPTRGLLPAGDFIAVAIQAGLIVPIGKFVLHEVCNVINDHPEFLGQIYINVSPRQIGTGQMAGILKHALDVTEIDPKRIVIEITESGVQAANKLARDDIDAIASLDVELAIDDFGTSYAALSSVVRHPISRIKLANEFTARLGDDGFGDRISLAAAGLTRALGVTGIVEGLEEAIQFARARVHGWHLGQGYFFGAPQPAEEIDFEAVALNLPQEALRLH